LLLEAALAEKPVISFQPTQKGGYPFAGTEFGLLPGTSSIGELAQFLKDSIHPAAWKPRGQKQRMRFRKLIRPDAVSQIIRSGLALVEKR